MDKFEQFLYRFGDWCSNHETATVGAIALAFGLLFGVWLAF